MAVSDYRHNRKRIRPNKLSFDNEVSEVRNETTSSYLTEATGLTRSNVSKACPVAQYK